MRPQIVHETEVHRQHVRLKIPIQVEIDGIRHQVDDWSLGGLAVESVLTSRKPGDRFWIRLIFPFEEFELTMRREARMVYVDQGHGRFGCASSVWASAMLKSSATWSMPTWPVSW
jgi:hypothetical protein